MSDISLKGSVVALTLVFAAYGCRGLGGAQTIDESVERTQSAGDPYDDCSSDRIAEVARLANRAREDEKRPPLHCSPQMSSVAEKHARDMCRQDYLSHTGKDGSTPAERGDAAGIEFRAFGENIAKGQHSPSAAHEGWMTSRRHRRNILRPKFSRIGVGYVDCDGRPIWVQVFAN